MSRTDQSNAQKGTEKCLKRNRMMLKKGQNNAKKGHILLNAKKGKEQC